MKLFKRHKADASASASTEPPKERYGLFFLHETPDADVDIVAVHGLGGHFEETWTDSDSKQLWLRDFLPSQLKDVGMSLNLPTLYLYNHSPWMQLLARPHLVEEARSAFAGIAARVMSYGYDSSTAFSKSVTDIEDQAKILIDALSSERASPSEKDRPLIFIAHSLGGIIVKKAMIIAHERSSIYSRVLDSIQALIFFGVPHRGSDLAYWSTYAARLMSTVQLGRGTNKSFVEALTRNSQTFADISQSFTERAAPLKIRTFYEIEKLHGFLIVDKDSARLGLPNENAVGVIAANHVTICKFDSRDSRRYRPVWKAIQALFEKKEENPASKSRSMIPFPRDPHFLGREDIIKLVDAKFKTERRVALTGAGGVGKSQVAIEYCYQFRDREADSHVFWIHASNKGRFEQAFKAISRKLRLPGWNNPDIDSLDLVSDWLSANSNWLLVLDNADDNDVFFDRRPTTTFQHPESQQSTKPMAMYIPQTSRRGSVLITSRNRDTAFRLTGCVENLIDVPYMNKEESIALLGNKLPKDDSSSDEEKFELVELLEYLPLALTQAASYIGVRSTRMTVARYSDLLRKSDGILHESMGDIRRDPTIPSSVFLTWQISFDQIKKESPSAAELLSIMSVFDRQGIPQCLLQNMDEDDFGFERRLAPLEYFSLITEDKSGQSFQMHRLVQMAIISWLERQREIDLWKKNAAILIGNSLPNTAYEFWKTWESLLPHAEVALKYKFSDQDSQLLHARILTKTAEYFEKRGRYGAAAERCQHALNIQVEVLGEDDIESVHCLMLLANLKRKGRGNVVRDIDEAEVFNRKALDLLERGQEKDSFARLYAQNQLAVTLLESHDDKKIEEATNLIQSILLFRVQNQAPDHQSTLATMNNLALAFRKQERFTEAEKLYHQVLETNLRTLGDEHPSTITSLHNLAFLPLKQRKYEEAQELARRALALRTTVLGEEHPETLNSMLLLIDALIGECKDVEAEELGRYALSLHKTVYGDIHRETVWCSNLLVSALRVQRKYEEAEELSRTLVDTLTTALTMNHPETILGMAGLGRVLHRQGKYEEVKELFRRVYERRPEVWDDDVWDEFLEDYSDTLARLGKYAAAAEISLERVCPEDSDLDSIRSDETGFKSPNMMGMSDMKNNFRSRSVSLS